MKAMKRVVGSCCVTEVLNSRDGHSMLLGLMYAGMLAALEI
jgi:hypothetical protein